MNKILITMLFFSICQVISAKNYLKGDTLNVVAFDGLIVRSESSRLGVKLAVLDFGEKVIIAEKPNLSVNIDSIFGFKGNWIQIESIQGLKGYVFDAFISTLPLVHPVYKENIVNDRLILDYFAELPTYLKNYVTDNFTITDCSLKYSNRSGGEGSHSFTMQEYGKGIALIEHSYWEGSAAELQLENIRTSEVYYLICQFFMIIDGKGFYLSKNQLKQRNNYFDYWKCVGGVQDDNCIVQLFMDRNGKYYIKFNFHCC